MRGPSWNDELLSQIFLSHFSRCGDFTVASQENNTWRRRKTMIATMSARSGNSKTFGQPARLAAQPRERHTGQVPRPQIELKAQRAAAPATTTQDFTDDELMYLGRS